MTTFPLSAAGVGLLDCLQATSGRACWISPAESVADAWVLITPVRAYQWLARRKFRETTITELVQLGLVQWTAEDEDVPVYMTGVLTRESWFKGRKGRRIEVAPNPTGRLPS